MQYKNGENRPVVFNHLTPPDIQELETESVDGKRYYKTPDGKLYPSVTTVVGSYTAKAIKEWRQRVGEEEARKITTQASVRGTKVHQLCEDYINNVPDYREKHMPVNLACFDTIRPVIEQKIDNVVMQEVPLYSHYLEVGGRVDCIADWDGTLSVIDFKTAKRRKEKDKIDNYFMQASAYCVMFEELTKTPINQIVILIAVDNDEPQIFIEKRDNYIHQFIKVRESYRDYHGK